MGESAGTVENKTIVDCPGGEEEKSKCGQRAEAKSPAPEHTGPNHLLGGFDLFVTDVDFLDLSELTLEVFRLSKKIKSRGARIL